MRSGRRSAAPPVFFVEPDEQLEDENSEGGIDEESCDAVEQKRHFGPLPGDSSGLSVSNRANYTVNPTIREPIFDYKKGF